MKNWHTSNPFQVKAHWLEHSQAIGEIKSTVRAIEVYQVLTDSISHSHELTNQKRNRSMSMSSRLVSQALATCIRPAILLCASPVHPVTMRMFTQSQWAYLPSHNEHMHADRQLTGGGNQENGPHFELSPITQWLILHKLDGASAETRFRKHLVASSNQRTQHTSDSRQGHKGELFIGINTNILVDGDVSRMLPIPTFGQY